MNNVSNLRIAWLLPVAWFYWQPTLSEFTRLFPETKIYTGLWPGFAKGFEDSISVEVTGEFKVIKQTQQKAQKSTGYGSGLTYLSPGIVKKLLQFKPHVIFASSFGIWTILALLLKPLGRWAVIIAYEGSSPGVDFRNSAIRLLIRRLMVQFADACITNSQAGKSYLTEVLKAEQNRVFARPYEIPAEKTLLENNSKIKPSIGQLKRPVFLFVGRVIPRKGLHILLEACAILKKRKHCNYTLLVVGDGPNLDELKLLSKDYGLENCVQWIGRVDYDRINAYFQSADAFVLPTLEDTWGVAVLEVMLFGKPVLCSTGAGTSEMIIDGENGYTFDPLQPEKLAELMSHFINNPSLIQTMGQKSRQVIAEHTPEKASRFLAEVTKIVLNQSADVV